MTRFHRAGDRLVVSTAVALAIAALAGGCGRAHTTAMSGKSLFASAGCGGCHTLAAAGSRGQIGPNLDDIAPAYATVVRQVTNGGNGMPSFHRKLTASAIRAVATYVASTAHYPGHIPQFTPTHTAVAQCATQDFLCLRQAFGNVAYADGPRAALAQLETAANSTPSLGRLCHQIAHEIGHAAYAKYNHNAAAALSQGAMTCGSGYYHGVVEMAFSGLPRSQVATGARQLCSSLAKTTGSFVLYQCVHGLGHGLMIYSADDLPYSLRVCDALPTYFDQQSCDGGAFMQNFITGPAAMVATPRTKSGDLLYPCDIVAPRDKPYCYLQITDRILPAVGYDWTKAAAWCERAQTDWTSDCFQSLGRDASGFEARRPDGILRICRLTHSGITDCIYGAVRDIADNDANGRRASALCATAPTSARNRCYEGLGSILGALHTQHRARATACDAVTPRPYRRWCETGAGLPESFRQPRPERLRLSSHMR